MRLSRFNIIVKDYPAQGEGLLFNARTMGILRINEVCRNALDSLKETGVAGPFILENEELLKKNGIIVDDERQEEEKLEGFFQQLRGGSRDLAFETTILTTYNCNFKCSYCFESSVRQAVMMDKETASCTAKWLIRHAQKKGIKKIYIVYYGGEPLLNTKPMFDISREVREWAKKSGVAFSFGVITNGSLLSPELVDRLVMAGLHEVRVTLDGSKEVHDSRRMYNDGSGTFDTIVNNLKKAAGKTRLGIAGNFDRESFKAIPALLDHLQKQGLFGHIDSFNFAAIVPRLGPKDNPAAAELMECVSYVGKDGLFEETIEIKRQLQKRGVKLRSGLAINACPLCMQDSGVTIDPTGMLYKCNSLLGYPEYSVGSVREEEYNAKCAEFLNIEAWRKCPLDCPYVPMCQGGCRFFSLVENKDLNGISCKREYFDRIMPELIKLEYDELRRIK